MQKAARRGEEHQLREKGKQRANLARFSPFDDFGFSVG
jgi:hypothetical protein